MIIKELIEQLRAVPLNLEVMLSDSAGPLECGAAGKYMITQEDADNTAGCEGRAGEVIVLLAR